MNNKNQTDKKKGLTTIFEKKINRIAGVIIAIAALIAALNQFPNLNFIARFIEFIEPSYHPHLIVKLPDGTKVDLWILKRELKNNQFSSANKETERLLFKIAGLDDQDYFFQGDSQNINCKDLKRIDGLWTQYSDNKFGFSVQSDVYLDVQRDWNRFVDSVGWRKNGSILLTRTELATDPKDAPSGHLPSTMFWIKDNSNFYGGIEHCRL
ncbi:MAG: GUN4 domain-containing protein [Cyanobacteria bacterium J06582_2]